VNNNHTLGRSQVGHCHQVGPPPWRPPLLLPSIVSSSTCLTLIQYNLDFAAALEGATICPSSCGIYKGKNMKDLFNYFKLSLIF